MLPIRLHSSDDGGTTGATSERRLTVVLVAPSNAIHAEQPLKGGAPNLPKLPSVAAIRRAG